MSEEIRHAKIPKGEAETEVKDKRKKSTKYRKGKEKWSQRRKLE